MINLLSRYKCKFVKNLSIFPDIKMYFSKWGIIYMIIVVSVVHMIIIHRFLSQVANKVFLYIYILCVCARSCEVHITHSYIRKKIPTLNAENDIGSGVRYLTDIMSVGF